MKIGKKIFILILFTQMSVFLYGQSNCNLYFDELKKGDTLKVSIVFFVNRSEIKEEVLIYKNEFKKCFALINTDNEKNVSIELTDSNLNIMKLFEVGIRKQYIESNVPLHIHSLAEYQISYKQGSVSYSTKEQFYSLYKELMGKHKK